MQTTVENTEKHTVKLTVEIPPDEYSKELDATYRSIANQVKIPGFRKGKVPKRIIDAQIGRDVVRDEFLEHAVPQYYRQAVSEEDLAPIADPEIDLDAFADDAPLVFTAVVEMRPRLELTEDEYSGLAVTRPSTEVPEQEIDEWIGRLRERFAELEPAERPALEGDFVTIDVKAVAEGEEVDGLTRTDYMYFVGSGEFGPALDAELVGTKAGDILKISEEMGPGAGEALPGQGGRPDGAGEGREGSQVARGRRRLREDRIGVRQPRGAPRGSAHPSRRDEGARGHGALSATACWTPWSTRSTSRSPRP